MAAETWFTASEAVANGFATSIAEAVAVAAMGSPDRYKYKACPELPPQPEAVAPKTPQQPSGTKKRLTRARLGVYN